MKKNKLFVISIIIILIIGITAGCSKSDGSGEKITMKLANGSSIGDERDKSLVRFAELVDKKSDGRIVIEVHSGGTLGSWRDTIEGLEAGVVQIVNESIGTLEAYSKTGSIDAYPFLYRDAAHYTKVMNSDIGKELLDTVGKEGGFELMGPSYRGPRIMTTNKKIEKIDDLKGFKLRAPGTDMYIKTWQALGAAPIPMDTSEIYTGIQQGTVQGQENPIMYSYGNAYYEVCDYLIMTNHVYSTDVFIFNDNYFNGLDKDVQDILREAAEESAEYRKELVIEGELDAIEKFKEEGVEIIVPEISGFEAKLENFSDNFPHLEEWVNKIQGVN